MAQVEDSIGDDDQVIWRVGVFDAHCHPTDIMDSIKDISKMRARSLTIMASRSQDQDLVDHVAKLYPLENSSDISDPVSRFVIPAFGWHPWFSYQMYDDSNSDIKVNAIDHYRQVLSPVPEDYEFLKALPTPRPMSLFIHETETRLLEYPHALVGEVGLDRAFRLPIGPFHSPSQVTNDTSEYQPDQYTPGSREGRSLTPYRVSIDHQKFVLRAQLNLAAKLHRAVSVHSVQAHGIIFDVLQDMWKGHERLSKRKQKRRKSVPGAHDAEDERGLDHQNTSRSSTGLPYPPRICMHSYSGPVDPLKQFLHQSVPVDIFFSFSYLINMSSPSSTKAIDVIKAISDSQILVESDYHCAGKEMDDFLLKIVKRVCEIKGWGLEEGAEVLKNNWNRFIFGEREAG